MAWTSRTVWQIAWSSLRWQAGFYLAQKVTWTIQSNSFEQDEEDDGGKASEGDPEESASVVITAAVSDLVHPYSLNAEHDEDKEASLLLSNIIDNWP